MAEQPICAVHVASRGPRFFRAGDGVMFEITLDHRSKIGPRPATEADSLAYPAAWLSFTDAELSEAEPAAPGEPLVKFVDHPAAKAEAERDAAERQARLDAKRSRGL